MHSDFGSTLRNARMRQGYDINTVARRLRIRPDVIQSIEDSDFDRMPPRGYARNMINSYAHLLGLNPSQITRQYLDELYAHQVNNARQASHPSAADLSDSRHHHRVGAEEDMHRGHEVRRGVRTRTEGSERFSHRVYDDGYDTVRPSHSRSSYPAGGSHVRTGSGYTTRNRGHRASSAAIGGSAYLNAYKGPTAAQSWTANWRNHLPLVGVVAAVIVLVVILLVLLFGPKGTDDQDVTNMPVTGVESAGTAEESSSSSSSSSATEQPTSFKFTYTVASGTSVWIECYVDGDTKIAETVTGPSTKTYTVKKRVEFMAASADGVSVKQDDNDVALQAGDSGGVDLVLKFSDYLSQWKKDNGVTSSSSSSSSDSTSSSSDSSSSSSSASDSSSSSSD